MNLQKINHYINSYIDQLSDPDYDGLVLWELAHQFQLNWDLDAPKFGLMFKESFAINSPLWNKDHFIPKKMMERYIGMNEDLARTMFKDLLNESKDITGRINRFKFQCDEFYKLDRAGNHNVLHHDHDDLKMVFIYLAFRYPEKYTLYNYTNFKTFMENIGSKATFMPQDIDRFIKVCRTILTLVQKNEALMTSVKSRIEPLTSGKIYPMLLVFEIYNYSV